MTRPAAIVIVLSMTAAASWACAARQGPAAAPSFKPLQEGKAVYYSSAYHGRKTASGEIYDENAFTAAHRTLAFGTVVKVTNLGNGKSVVVRINDRGPFGKKKERIIDLSLAAARKIDMVKAGVVPVLLEVQKN
jgi:rare lipoprotein A